MAGRLRMNHFVGHMIGKVPLQFGMAFEKRQVALIGDAVKIVDLGDEAVPVLPENFDRLHGQSSALPYPCESGH